MDAEKPVCDARAESNLPLLLHAAGGEFVLINMGRC